jgi:hypothetical protein
MASKQGTVTISIKEYDELKIGFERSKDREKLLNCIVELRKKREELKAEIHEILNNNFIIVHSKWSVLNEYYSSKDKTPLWIRKIFN